MDLYRTNYISIELRIFLFKYLFFNSQTFIMENRTQTEVLLRTILAHPKIVGLLLPIFQPSTCEDCFTEMYENVIQTNLDVEVKFSLLSKVYASV